MHATPSHYHHHADLLTCIEHIRWKTPVPCVNIWWVYSIGSVSQMLLILSVTFPIFCKMCRVYVLNWPIEVYAIERIYKKCILLDVSTFPIVVIFSVGMCLRWLYHHLLSVSYKCIYPGTGLWCTQIVEYGPMVVLACLHTTSLSSLFRHVWRYWTSKMLVMCILSSV